MRQPKRQWKVAIEVRKLYHLTLKASNRDDAARRANELTSLAIPRLGKLEDIEVAVIEIEEDLDE